MISSEALRPANAGRKGLGKLAARLEEVKNPWRQGSTLELSHNEAARLATDALLESGEKEYRRVLTEEKELNFLSSQEIKYISDNAAKNNDDSSCAKGSEGDFAEVDAVSELTSGTYFPMMSDEEPPLLELGWPEVPQRYGPSETQIYFQRDKSHNVKDLIRSLINKAKKVIALVMDLFTDVDLICDLMEASNKRKVPVYILLDEKNLNHFIEMCTALDIHNSHLCNMRIRSVIGETYCTKSGKKFTGQVQEKFLIIDCEEVIAGSYSFTWLSAQVHSNMVLHFTGRIAEIFDREFRCLYADSQIIDGFHDPEEEGLPVYPLSTVLPNISFGVQQERYREKVYSEHSSSLSSGSVSSIKKAPNMPNPTYRINHDKKEPNSTSLSPERRAGLSQGPHTPGNHLVRGVTNGQDLAASGDGLASGIEWSKAGSPDSVRPAVGGATSKIQALGLYEAKPTSHVRSGSKSPPGVDAKINPRLRGPSTPFLNKITEFFSAPGKDRDTYNFSRPQLNPSAAFGGPDLTQTEPESKQKLPFPAPLPTELMHTSQPINRRDLNRMTLGHSKLDLVNHYNQMKPKHAYSRFESKNNH